MKQKTLILLLTAIIIVTLGTVLYLFYTSPKDIPVIVNNPDTSFKDTPVVINNPNTSATSSIVYKNTNYGFNFYLPLSWKGYVVIEDGWKGSPLKNKATQMGPKLLIRNPKWTAAKPYEDLPILIFTISTWNMYLAEEFSVSAAPVQATELARNNKYVFALPPRWDFDYNADYKEAQDIFASKPIQAFNTEVSQGKLNIDLICEKATSYMKFVDSKSRETFVADCKEGKHPEVIEKYKADMNLGDGAMI